MNNKETCLDFNRPERLGMVEAVWGENKTAKQIEGILRSIRNKEKMGFVTRVNNEKAEALIKVFPDAEFHENARCITLGRYFERDPSLGEVQVITGGTSDCYVASEAELALRVHGIDVSLTMDIGVAGLHRLLGNINRFKNSKVLIVCAGMEGSLPTIVSGLLPQPIIGVPTSIGYGVSSFGRTALEGMLASCAPGLVVVNIDNGYGAAMAALRILKSQN